MKRLLLLCALAIPCFMACEKMDEVVSPDVEQQQDPLADVIRIAMDGASMLEDGATRATANRRVNLDAISCKIHPATRAGEANDTLYYVVNYADNAGFAIVSADEHATDGERLLAVIEQGSYTAGETTGIGGFDGFVSLLDYEIIGGKDSLTLDLSRYETVMTESHWSGVGPYLQVQWGQGGAYGAFPNSYNYDMPYNKYCIKNNALCPTGCAAVAMAQVMSYHKRPLTYTRYHDGSAANTTLDWDSIVTWVGGEYDPEWDDADGDAIAHLMREMGHRVNLEYGYNETNYSFDQISASLDTFGYTINPSLPYDYQTIVNELVQSRPVFIGGGETVNVLAGHLWVADGYKYNEQHHITYKITPLPRGDVYEIIQEYDETYRYLHYNWGYDGICNGYFADGVFQGSNVSIAPGGYDNPTYNNSDTRKFKYNVVVFTNISYTN